MCKFKAGDRVVITNSGEDNPSILKNGVTGIVLDNHSCPFVQFDVIEDDSLNDAIGLGVGGRCYSVCENEIDLFHPYIQSNRYKLQQAIKKTGFHAEKLSLASNHAKTYFTGFTAESRFNSRGDITEERLNALLTTLAFAERELLGVGAKNVDYIETSQPIEFFGHGELRVLKPIDDTIPKPDEKGEVFTPDEKKALDHINHVCFDPDWKSLQHWEKRNEPEVGETQNWKLEKSNLNKEKSDSLKSVLIAFLVVVVLLALWFLFK